MTNRSQKPRAMGAINRAKHKARTHRPRVAARIALSLSAMVVGLIVLAATTSIPNVTRAPGAILPQGHYSQIETIEGGIVEAIHVSEGQIVETGAPLIELKQPDLVRSIQTLGAQVAHEQSRLANLQALQAALTAPSQATSKTVDQLRNGGFESAAEQLDLHVQSQWVKALEIERQSETIDILAAALDFAEERVAARLTQMEKTRALRDQGLMTKRQFHDEQEQLNTLRASANAARVELAEARSELTRKTSERDTTQLTLQEKTRADIQSKSDVLVELATALTESNERAADLSIVAPEAGLIQSVAMPNLGEVIEPGETLFEIVPAERGLVVEARIPGNDIGHVDMTQPISVGIDTFDQRRFGRVSGRLLSLSPAPLTDEATGEHYFRAAIGLDRSQIGQGKQLRSLRSGMTVVAEIVTGEQTVLAYFLKPIDATLRNSFRER